MEVVEIIIMTLLLRVSTAKSQTDNERLVWSICDESSCTCGDTIKESVKCTNNSELLWIQPCYCLYYDRQYNGTIAGECFFTCFYHTMSDTGSIYYPITRHLLINASLINAEVCGAIPHLHRTGRFCGKCKKGYGLAVYSYNYLECIPCEDYGLKNWVKFLAAALLPLTVFYLLVILLRISITSSRLNGLVFVVQCLTSPLQQRGQLGELHASSKEWHSSTEFVLFRTEMTIYGAFNLDFFRAFFPDICLHPDLNFMHVVSLDLIIALYPFFLIAVTYFLVHVYDRKLRLVVWLCSLIKRYTNHYNYNLQLRTSIVEAFATFILLSSFKILGVCSDLLFPTVSYHTDGKVLQKKFLHYDATIEYFGSKHLPFAILALCIGFVFLVLPFLLLFLYPCKCFQKFLNTFNSRGQALHIFMDVFQGNYRTQPRDLRYFSAFYLFLRFIFAFSIMFIHSIVWLPLNCGIILLSALVVSLFQPYKNSRHNQCDVVFLLELAFICVSYTALVISSAQAKRWLGLSQLFAISSTTLMLLTYTVVLLARLNTFCHMKFQILAFTKKCFHFFNKKDYCLIPDEQDDGILEETRLLTHVNESNLHVPSTR